jgi:hypothetical protein
VTSSARETFTPCELTDAYKQFKEHGPQYLSNETGLRASAYRFGAWWSVFTQPRRKGNSAKFALTEFYDVRRLLA